MSKGWKGGSTTYWRKVVRPAVFQRDNFECQLKIPGEWKTWRGETRHCLGVADCVHHTHGIQNTGHDMRYLVAACTPCNLKVGDPTRTPDPPLVPLTEW